MEKMSIIDEINKRRTFANISHPDAGKTLTEKFLLFAGAIQTAGAVTDQHSKNDTSIRALLERDKE